MDGLTSQYDSYFDHRASELGLNISLVLLTILTVGLRFLARRRSKAAVALDDWLMVAALAMFLTIIGFGVWHSFEREQEGESLLLRAAMLERTLKVFAPLKLDQNCGI